MALDLFYTVILMAIIGAGTFCSTLFTLAHFGGWSQLASRYQTRALPDLRLRGRTIFTRMGGYRNCVQLGADAQYFYMGIAPIFRPFHPPLAIPFSDIDIDTRPGLAPSGCSVLNIDHSFMRICLFRDDIAWIEARFAEAATD